MSDAADKKAASFMEELMKAMGSGASASRLQSFLQKSSSSEGGRMQGLLQKIKGLPADSSEEEAAADFSDPSEVLMGLTELSEILAVSSEDSLASGFRVDQFVPVLVGHLSNAPTPEIKLSAGRCITYILEALPNSCCAICNAGGVAALISNLLSIELIDVAEQCLQTLEKLSKDHAPAVLTAGGLAAALQYMDFFSASSQRSAAGIAANCCKGAKQETLDSILVGLPLMARLLEMPDQKVVENGALCFMRMAEGFRSSSANLEIMFCEVTEKLLQLSGSTAGPGSVTPTTKSLAMRALSIAAGGCPAIAEELRSSASEMLVATLLSLSGTSGSSTSSSASPPRRSLTTSSQADTLPSTALLSDIIGLTFKLLPPVSKQILPDLSIPTPPPVPAPKKGLKKSSTEIPPPLPPGEDPNAGEEPLAQASDQMDVDEESQEGPSPLAAEFSAQLLPALTSVYQNTLPVQAVRKVYLQTICRAVLSIPSAKLSEVLKASSFVNFLARIIGSDDVSVAATGVGLAKILLQTDRDKFIADFTHHGLVHELKQLASQKSGALATRSQDLLQKYFSSEDKKMAAKMEKLRQLSASLLSAKDSSSLLLTLRDELVDSESGVSSFELLESGCVSALVSWLSTKDPQIAGTRAELFARTISSKEGAFSRLLFLLHDALVKIEKFPVNTSPEGSLRFLTQAFRVKIRRAEGEKDLKDLPSSGDATISVEPLATTLAIEDWIWSKVKSDSSSTPLPPSETKSEEDQEGKDEDEEDEEEETIDSGSHDDDDQAAPPQTMDVDGAPSGGTSTMKTSRETLSRSRTMVVPPQDKLAPKLVISLGSTPLQRHSSFFESIQSHLAKSESSGSSLGPQETLSRMWSNVYELTYRKADASTASTSPSSSPVRGLTPPVSLPNSNVITIIPSEYSPVGYSLSKLETPEFIKGEACVPLIQLLSLLYFINERGSSLLSDSPAAFTNFRPLVSPQEFINGKLSGKVSRMLQDPLAICAGALPGWTKGLVQNYPFLIDYETRLLYFQCTSFGIARALNALQQQSQARATSLRGSREREQQSRYGRIPRQKVRISRQKVLESAIRVFELGSLKSLLEVEYFGESGTGLGPTLEFYTLVSRELQRVTHSLWFQESTAKPVGPEGYAFAPTGLYPAPSGLKHPQKVLDLATFMGTFCAKAVLDQRMLDAPLSPAFLRWLVGKPLSVEDVASISETIGGSLTKMALAVRGKFGGLSVDGLGLDYTFPGRPEWELLPAGASIDVTTANAADYVTKVTEMFLRAGGFLEAFKAGWEKVFPSSALKIFSAGELESLMLGTEDEGTWQFQSLMESIKCDHGYTQDSRQVEDLAMVMAEFTPEQRKLFVLFLTGSPRLPIGGFKALNPRFTVVEKSYDTAAQADLHLPSVNCCFYYLKLPRYSSREVLRSRLLYTISNGQGAFDMT